MLRYVASVASFVAIMSSQSPSDCLFAPRASFFGSLASPSEAFALAAA